MSVFPRDYPSLTLAAATFCFYPGPSAYLSVLSAASPPFQHHAAIKTGKEALPECILLLAPCLDPGPPAASPPPDNRTTRIQEHIMNVTPPFLRLVTQTESTLLPKPAPARAHPMGPSLGDYTTKAGKPSSSVSPKPADEPCSRTQLTKAPALW